jgi:hypothetical protein
VTRKLTWHAIAIVTAGRRSARSNDRSAQALQRSPGSSIGLIHFMGTQSSAEGNPTIIGLNALSDGKAMPLWPMVWSMKQ